MEQLQRYDNNKSCINIPFRILPMKDTDEEKNDFSFYNQDYEFDCLVDHRFVGGKIEYLARYCDTVK